MASLSALGYCTRKVCNDALAMLSASVFSLTWRVYGFRILAASRCAVIIRSGECQSSPVPGHAIRTLSPSWSIFHSPFLAPICRSRSTRCATSQRYCSWMVTIECHCPSKRMLNSFALVPPSANGFSGRASFAESEVCSFGPVQMAAERSESSLPRLSISSAPHFTEPTSIFVNSKLLFEYPKVPQGLAV
jgi:hypothetical protein